MDIKIWESTIVVWVLHHVEYHLTVELVEQNQCRVTFDIGVESVKLNTICSSPVDNINQIDDSLLKEVLEKISLNPEISPVKFLNDIHQNLKQKESFNPSCVDYLCASTLLLIYVSLTNTEDLNEIRDLMCTKLSTSAQLNIVEFLNSIQECEDIFNASYKKFKQEIFPGIFLNFKEKHCFQNSGIGEASSTPVKNDPTNSSFDSPLQGFFQTPKRNKNKYLKNTYTACSDPDHIKRIKKLTDQLVEEESEKTSLQEHLNIQTQKCNEYEMKLKGKIHEINQLKEEWEKESKKNEEDANLLRNRLKEKLETEKKLKSELMNLENYISKVELDLSTLGIKNSQLENQLKSTSEKYTASEEQLKEVTELCTKLQGTISEQEKELIEYSENYVNIYQDEKAIDLSFMNKSLDKSVCSPENMGVVVDQLLREKIEENAALQELIEQLKLEKKNLMNEKKALSEDLTHKYITEYKNLKKELDAKIEKFEKSEKELLKVQTALNEANQEIMKLNKEKCHLHEKYNILNERHQEREQILINCNHSKINFIKLAEDFKAVQQRLEFEINNISKLALGKCEELAKVESELRSMQLYDVKNFKDEFNKNTSNIHSEQNSPTVKDENESVGFTKFAELLQNCDGHIDWSESKTSLQKTCERLNDSIILLRTKIQEFEESYRSAMESKLKFERQLKDAVEKMTELQSSNSWEIKKFSQQLQEKENKIKELESIIFHLKKDHEKLVLEKELIIKETNNLLIPEIKSHNIIHEGGDYQCVRTVAFGTIHTDSDSKFEPPGDRQEFSDSLEEVPVDMPNKTFDIVNLEEKNLSDKTFSIKKEDIQTFNKSLKGDTTWVISPPSKVPVKKSKEGVKSVENRGLQGESWIVPVGSAKSRDSKIKKVSSINDLRSKPEEAKVIELQKEILSLTKDCERFKFALLESEQKRAKEKEHFEKNQDVIRQNITAKYESQLEHLKTEMKQLYNRELAKHKQEQSSMNSELQDQNKRYKEHIDELRNQLWDLGEKLLQEQTLMRDLKRNFNEIKEKYERLMLSKETDPLQPVNRTEDLPRQKESLVDDSIRTTSIRQLNTVTFATIPTEDEEEVFDNRFLEDMKLGVCKTERAEERLRELQYRNSLCLPHLKSSYPGETQFHNPTLFKENDLKLGLLQFTQESQSLTDSDHSMTRSLLPDSKGKKKEQTSYKRPGPPTPSKNGGRLSIQNGDLRVTPRNALRELNDQNERNKGTPNPLKFLLTTKSIRRTSVGGRDENAAPVTPRKKNFFRKPFGARDH